MPDNPNILIIWGDDIGISNLSCYSEGLMGYRTPNIDRIAAEGVRYMAGNVWEWTEDCWTSRHTDDAGSLLCAGESPRRRGRVQLRPRPAQFRIGRKVIKGGSHLCADSYCLRYRPAARRPQMVDTGMSHIGFRCVATARPPSGA